MLDGTLIPQLICHPNLSRQAGGAFREALLRLEEGETFINAGQSGADGGGVVVQLIMTLAAQPLPVSLRNEGVGGVHILWMSRLFVVRCAALWMPCSENHNKASQTVRFLFFGVKWRRGPAVWGGGGRGYLRQCIFECSPLQGLRRAVETVCSHGALFLN